MPFAKRMPFARGANWTLVFGITFPTINLLNVATPFVGENVVHSYHQYTIKSQNRDSLSSYLSEKGIGNGVYYPTPVHKLPSFDLTLDLPHTNIAAKEVLSIPVHPFLKDEEVEIVIEVINKWS